MAGHKPEKVEELDRQIIAFHANRRALPGLVEASHRTTFVMQLIDSSRRTEYIAVMRDKVISADRANPESVHFDPILAAILKSRSGEYDEACWLTFLAINCGKHSATGWDLCRALYGNLGQHGIATWEFAQANLVDYCGWIHENANALRSGPPRRNFGNHRKFETLRDLGNRGTPAAIRTYVQWIAQEQGHRHLFDSAVRRTPGNPQLAFDYLYAGMNVASFGRLAKFDYLSMIGKLGLADIVAGSTYVTGSTGPMTGARQIFFEDGDGRIANSVLESRMSELALTLGVTMQDMEDAVCNWQKSPAKYKKFRA